MEFFLSFKTFEFRCCAKFDFSFLVGDVILFESRKPKKNYNNCKNFIYKNYLFKAFLNVKCYA